MKSKIKSELIVGDVPLHPLAASSRCLNCGRILNDSIPPKKFCGDLCASWYEKEKAWFMGHAEQNGKNK